MELRVLQYFLAVAREQSILHAAESLHLSQPTPIQTAERAGGGAGQARLFVRSNRKITLTEEGMILRKRAAEILELVKKAENEIAWSNEVIAGDITLGAGETEGVRVLARAAHALRREHPLVHFHIHSGDSATVTEELDRGLIDFGLFAGRCGYLQIRSPGASLSGYLGSSHAAGCTPGPKRRPLHQRICGINR